MKWIALLLAAYCLGGCRTSRLIAPRQVAPRQAVPERVSMTLRGDRLTLGELRARILEKANLHLAAEEYRTAEARGLVRQATLPPNPYVMLRRRRIREFDVIGSGFGEFEVGQPIELGKKRRARILLAQAQAATVSEALRALTLLTLHDAEAWFYRLLRLEQDLEVAREAEKVASELEALARTRFEGGKDSRVPVLRFKAATATARLAVQDIEREYQSACRAMDEFVGVAAGTTHGADGRWEAADLGSFDRVAAHEALRAHPRLRVTERELEAARRSVRRARSDAWPNLTVAMQGEHDFDLGKSYLGVSLYMPVPLWNRNQGERVRAQAAVWRARKSIDAETLKLEVELERAILAHDRATRNVNGYEKGIIPTLDTSVELARAAYAGGKGSYLDVLDALLAWIQARRERLSHMEAQAQATVAIRYLTGGL